MTFQIKIFPPTKNIEAEINIFLEDNPNIIFNGVHVDIVQEGLYWACIIYQTRGKNIDTEYLEKLNMILDKLNEKRKEGTDPTTLLLFKYLMDTNIKKDINLSDVFLDMCNAFTESTEKFNNLFKK